MDNVEKILRYKQLLDEGIITQEEFDLKRRELLSLPESQPVQQNMQRSMPQQPAQQVMPQQPVQQAAPQKQEGSVGWGVLGFFVPIVGLILFLVWNDKDPQNARYAGIGALIGFILGVVCSVIYFAVIAASVGSMY